MWLEFYLSESTDSLGSMQNFCLVMLPVMDIETVVLDAVIVSRLHQKYDRIIKLEISRVEAHEVLNQFRASLSVCRIGSVSVRQGRKPSGWLAVWRIFGFWHLYRRFQTVPIVRLARLRIGTLVLCFKSCLFCGCRTHPYPVLKSQNFDATFHFLSLK